MIYKVLYISRSKVSHEGARHIADQASAINSTKNITGVLFFDGEYFCQHLEGDKANVNMIFEKIKIDHRHTNVFLMEEGFIEARKYKDWHMRYEELPEETALLCDLNYIKSLIENDQAKLENYSAEIQKLQNGF